VVKTLCTLNAHWRNTKTMVANLCRMFGESCPGDGEAFTFPGPDQLAAASAPDLQAAKLGFRARYVSEFARRVVGG
jgi:3-methyladenine DNA glycosylase/8-oxoguanine DNA glycosylase